MPKLRAISSGYDKCKTKYLLCDGRVCQYNPSGSICQYNPDRAHWRLVKRIFRDLQGTKGMKLCFGMSNPEIIGYFNIYSYSMERLFLS